MMIAPTERYTPPLITFISFFISFTSFRRLFFSSLVISDLFILLISSRRCVNTVVLAISVPLTLEDSGAITRHDLPGDEYRVASAGTGYRYVVVNGQITIEDDEQTNVHSGLLLRHGR